METGWHSDPTGRYMRRYFDGANWTNQVQTSSGEVLAESLPAPEATLPVEHLDSKTRGKRRTGSFLIPLLFVALIGATCWQLLEINGLRKEVEGLKRDLDSTERDVSWLEGDLSDLEDSTVEYNYNKFGPSLLDRIEDLEDCASDIGDILDNRYVYYVDC